jgi:hypothetical protein
MLRQRGYQPGSAAFIHPQDLSHLDDAGTWPGLTQDIKDCQPTRKGLDLRHCCGLYSYVDLYAVI